MRRIFIGTLVVLTIALINGCANRKITRVDPNETIDLSGRWNDSDSRLVSEEMIGPAYLSLDSKILESKRQTPRGGSRPRGEQKSRAY